MMRHATAITQALCAALLLQGAAAFQIWLNTNQLPDEMNRRADEWTESKAVIEGLIGLGAPHPTDPMPNTEAAGRKRAKFMQSFGDVPRILTQPWTKWEAANGTGVIEKSEKLGFYADEVFLWGMDDDKGPDFRMTLSPGQLDQVAASPDVDEALILVKSFGTGLKWKDNITPSIDHPACGGVVMEVRSEFWCDNEDTPDQPHFAAARYVAESGKRLFIMPPPRDHETKPLPGQMACMTDALYGALGEDFFCSGGFHIVASAYNYGPLKIFPERTADGDIAQSFTGGILTLQEKRVELCGTAGGSDVDGTLSVPEPEVAPEPAPEVVQPKPQPEPEPVAEVVEPEPEPVVEPEVEDAADEDGDDEDDDDEDALPAFLPPSLKAKGSRVHSSGLTAAEMVAGIRAQRAAGSHTKVTVRSRSVRRGRRMRGSVRTSGLTVAKVVVAVDEEGDAVDGGSSGGDGVQGVRVYTSSTSEGDDSDGDDADGNDSDGGEEAEEGGKRSWFKCMKDCMKGCCDGMKKCMKACCEGMKDCMKACCEGMKAAMKACCDGVMKCCDGVKACCKGMCGCVKAACKCMKKIMFTEEADEHEAM